MKILHYIRDFRNTSDDTVQSVGRMFSATAKVAENHLLTVFRLPVEIEQTLSSQYGVVLHYIDAPRRSNPLSYLFLGGKAKKIMKLLAPDVVHIHASWDFCAAKVEKAARKRKIVTIVSPHGGLAPEIVNPDFWQYRLPRMLAYQNGMMRRSMAIMTLSEAERTDVKNQGLRAEARIELLTDAAEQLMPLYRKSLDTAYASYMTEEEKGFVHDAVVAAVSDTHVGAAGEMLTQGLSFRRIFLYAWDEDVTDLLLQGAEKMQVQLPPQLNVEQLPRYRNKNSKQRGALIDVASKPRKIKISADHKEEFLAVTLIGKAQSLGKKKLTLRHWTELYHLFRHIDFNEDDVAKELKRLGLKKTAKKIQKTLGKHYAMPRGYDIF